MNQTTMKKQLIRAFGRHVELTVSDIANRARDAGLTVSEDKARGVMDELCAEGMAKRYVLRNQAVTVYQVTPEARKWASAYLDDDVASPVQFEDRKAAREKEFARLVEEGKSVSEIADAMGRTYNSVLKMAKRRGLKIAPAKLGRPREARA